MTWVELIGYIIAVIALVIGFAVSGGNGRYVLATACAVMLIVVIVRMGFYLLGAIEDDYAVYGERCRERGGVPVSMGGSPNCQGPDGRWLDVQW